MLYADGGAGTSWSSMTVPQMQALIQNPNIDQYKAMLTGWQQSSDLIIQHMSQVTQYRDNLAEAWPPEKSAASAAYIAQLDLMLGNLSQTYEAAIANHQAFSNATSSIAEAQQAMQSVFEQHQKNEQLLVDYNNQQQEKQKDYFHFAGDPPVTAAQQEQLRRQAVSLMSHASSELVQSQVKIVTPPAFSMGDRIDDKVTPIDGNTHNPPPIPAIIPVPVIHNGVSASSSRAPINFPTGAGTTAHNATPPSPNQPGLILGGTTTPTPSSPFPGSIKPTIPSGTPSPALSSSVMPVTANPLIPHGGSLPPKTGGAGRGLTVPGENEIRSGGSSSGPVRAMPPGGIIGSTPQAGLGQPRTTQATARRVNPVGGVIGENEPVTRNGGIRTGSGGVGGLGAEGSIGGARTGTTTGRGTASSRGTSSGRTGSLGGGLSEGEHTNGYGGRSTTTSGRTGSLGGGLPEGEHTNGYGGRSTTTSGRTGSLGGGLPEGEHTNGSASSRGLSVSERAAGGARGNFSEQQPYGQAGASRRGERRDGPEGKRWDPDNPWETEQGVAPVVIPAQEQRIDPGPAIGLY